MRVLVTGGAGFIGSHLTERLLRDGHEVVILDLLSDYYSPYLKRQNLREIRETGQFEFVQGDITDEEAVDAVVRDHRIEAIAHLAASVGVGPSVHHAAAYERANVQGTVVLLEAARRHGVSKFILASSSSVYGETTDVPFREDNLAIRPISPYGVTKLAAEQMCYAYAHLYPLSIICLRFFTVYGPRQRPDLALCKFVRLIEAGAAIPVYGDGSSSRDYTYCDDIVNGAAAALRLDARFEVMNLGSARPIALCSMIAALEKALGRRAEIEWLPEQPGDLRSTYADISKAERLLDYRAAMPFEEGVNRLVEWYRMRQAAGIGAF